MNVFLTGATGFVGSHVAHAFAAQGARLHLLVRSTSRLDNLQGLSAGTVIGDLRDPESFRSALSDCEVLVHVAADYRLWVRDPQAMYAANVDGTRDLLALAHRDSGRMHARSMGLRGSKHSEDLEGVSPPPPAPPGDGLDPPNVPAGAETFRLTLNAGLRRS